MMQLGGSCEWRAPRLGDPVGVEILPLNREPWGSLGSVKFLGKVAGDFLTGTGGVPGQKYHQGETALQAQAELYITALLINSPSRLPSLVSSLTGRLDGVEVLARLGGSGAVTSCFPSTASTFRFTWSSLGPLSEMLSSSPSSLWPGSPTVFESSVISCTEMKRQQRCGLIREPLSPPSGWSVTQHPKWALHVIKSEIRCKSSARMLVASPISWLVVSF